MGIDLKLQQGKGVTSRYVVSPMALLGDLDHIGHTDHYNPDHTNQNFGGLRNCHHTFKNLWERNHKQRLLVQTSGNMHSSKVGPEIDGPIQEIK